MLQQTQSATAIRLRKASTGINPHWEHRIFASRGQIRAGNAKFLRHGGNSALGTQNSCVTGATPRWEGKILASRGQIRAGNTEFLRHGGKSALGTQNSCVTGTFLFGFRFVTQEFQQDAIFFRGIAKKTGRTDFHHICAQNFFGKSFSLYRVTL